MARPSVKSSSESSASPQEEPPLSLQGAPGISPQAKSIALLRSARALALKKDWIAARAEFSKVTATADAPAHHRLEAEECLREVDRQQAGLPACDPAERRVPPPRLPLPGMEIHVAPSGTDLQAGSSATPGSNSHRGSDANPGTAELPFATLERARDEIRVFKLRGALPDGGVAVVVRGGEYRVSRTFQLGAEDSGTEAAPVVYRAASGEKPTFRGGLRISGFRPVTDAAVLERLPEEARGKVLQADIRTAGVEQVIPFRLGGFASGAGFRTWPVVEVFFRGTAMPLARWPNDGFVRIAEVTGNDGHQIHGIQGAKEGRFAYVGDRPRRWRGEPDAWLYGYWFFDWADSYERVASIDPERREIVLAPPYHGYGYRKGQRYRAVNLLSEIDAPGEWYLDRTSLILYFWPPPPAVSSAEGTAVGVMAGPAGAGVGAPVDAEPAAPEALSALSVELSLADFPMVEMKGVSNVALVGLTWELGAADGIILRGGERCLVAGCTVRRLGGNGVEVQGGRSHAILSCDIESLGRGGIVLSGGDRRNLGAGGHTVENCHIRDLSRIDHTYTPGVLVEGVGNRISHNLVHGVASSAFRVEGNDHMLELNEVFDVLLESDDQGGADMFGNPTYRGNVFRHNWWHHIGSWRGDGEKPGCGQAGIRLDDAICGVLVYGNVFAKCSAGALGFGGVQIHGGKENIVDGNLFMDCAAAISLSPWGEQRWRDFVRDALAKGGIDRARYLARYPELARLDEAHDSNRVWRNVVVRCGSFLLRDPGSLDLVENWVVADAPEVAGDHGLVAGGPEAFAGRDSPACGRIGFRPIPLNEVGLYTDEYRSEMPTDLLRQARAR